MAKIKPRVKVPKTAAVGEVIELKALISHPMHTGLAKNKKTGEKIPRKIINRMTVSFDDEEFLKSVNLAKWNIYSIALQDLIFYTLSYLNVFYRHQAI